MAADSSAPQGGRWPAWTVPAAIVAGTLAGQLAAIVAILPLAALGSGDGDISGLSLLVASLAFGAALIGTIALFVRSSERLSARTLGLLIPAAGPALAWTALGAALVAAFVFLWSQVVDLSDAFAVPSELDGRNSLAERLDVGQPPDRAEVGIGAFASVLARVVVPAVVAEVVLRGFALPALARWRGEPIALAITAVLTLGSLGFALDVPEEAAASLLPIALVLGTVLGLLYLLTGSLLPGIGLSAATMGAGLGTAFGWSVPGIAVLSLACCALAAGIAAAVATRAVPRR